MAAFFDEKSVEPAPLLPLNSAGVAICVVSGGLLCVWTAWLFAVPLFAESFLASPEGAALARAASSASSWPAAKRLAAAALDPLAGASIVTCILLVSLAVLATVACFEAGRGRSAEARQK